MPDFPDYYAILQVHPSASKEVIDAAYRKLAARYHPDVSTSPDAVENMKRLNEAYETLSSRSKRKAYDSSRGNTPVMPIKVSSFGMRKKIILLIGLILFIVTIAKLKILGLLLLIGVMMILLTRKKRK